MPRGPYAGYTLDELSRLVAQVESSGGKNIGPRYEPGFQERYGQRWVTADPFRVEMLQQFGPEKVYASYGPHQIMYPVAVELGFRGTPDELADPVVNRQYFEKKFLGDWKRTKGNLQKTLLRYNGGGDSTYPNRVLKGHPGGTMPRGPKPLSALPQEDPVERDARQMNQVMIATGFKPLAAPELERFLASREPPQPIRGIKRQTGDSILPFPDAEDWGQDGRDALFRSSVPMVSALGPTRPPAALTGQGFSGMTGLEDDQDLLRQLRTRRIPGSY